MASRLWWKEIDLEANGWAMELGASSNVSDCSDWDIPSNDQQQYLNKLHEKLERKSKPQNSTMSKSLSRLNFRIEQQQQRYSAYCWKRFFFTCTCMHVVHRRLATAALLMTECTLYGVGHKKNAVLIIEDSFSAFNIFIIVIFFVYDLELHALF